MNAVANRKAASAVNIFDPVARLADVPDLARSGRRRRFEPKASRQWLWPKTRPNQRDAFRAWKYVASQVIREARYEHRTLAAFADFINWKSGKIFASNEDLGRAAGGFSAKTASRDVAAYVALGIITIDLGWRRKEGKIVRCRTITLAVPINLPASVTLSGIENHVDHCGPDGGAE